MIRNVKLAEVVETKARDGRGVRVVGRLAEDNSGIYVEAEHIELRPEPKGAK
jgi:TolB-like protein